MNGKIDEIEVKPLHDLIYFPGLPGFEIRFMLVNHELNQDFMRVIPGVTQYGMNLWEGSWYSIVPLHYGMA